MKGDVDHSNSDVWLMTHAKEILVIEETNFESNHKFCSNSKK